jgi:hypothetical protein
MSSFIQNKETGFKIEKHGAAFVIVANSGRIYGSKMTIEKAENSMETLKEYHHVK